MKKIILYAVSLITAYSWGQQAPTVNNPGNGGATNPNYWSRAGSSDNGGGTNNIFGTRWNSPIYFITGGLAQNTYRARLNGDFTFPNQYPINGYTFSNDQNGVNTSGYFGLGFNKDALWSQNPASGLGNPRGPFSLLHLNGREGDFVQQFGFRPWMKTGITFTDNNDLSYMGLRKLGNGIDVTETTITWSDNPGSAFGPDHFVFRFTEGGGFTNTSNNLRRADDIDGLHVLRMSGEGLAGLGNTFGINEGTNIYSAMQSLLHMSYDRRNGGANQERYGFMQITYRDDINRPGTGETHNDGLRFGLDNQLYDNNTSVHAFLRWQENTPFIVQTDWNDIAGGIQNGERLRVSTINSFDVPQPLINSGNNNITRISVSHRGNQPVTQPRSLMHLGYNTGANNPFGIATDDGWRNWMDIGTFTSNGTDNMYVGLKEEGNDRYDAIINWGDNQSAGVNNVGPDNLRFVFTSTTTGVSGQGDPISQSADGLEVARMIPGLASTMPASNYGMVGIGNFTANNPGAPAPIDAKLDIDGDLRIREVTEDASLTQVLVINPADENRVHWKTIEPINGGFGADCTDPDPLAGALTADNRVNLNNQNLYFTNNDIIGKNRTGFGYDCSEPLEAKLNVYSEDEEWNSDFYTNNLVPVNPNFQGGIRSRIDRTQSENATGIYSFVAENNNLSMQEQIAIHGEINTLDAKQAYGVRGTVNALQPNTPATGGYFETFGSSNTRAVIARAFVENQGTPMSGIGWGSDNVANGTDCLSLNGVRGAAFGNGNNTVTGGVFQANGNNQVNYGVRAIASGGNLSYAGFFQGNVRITGVLTLPGGTVTGSDAQFKTDVNLIDNPLDLLGQLQPKRYYYDTVNYSEFMFESDEQMGLIAQEVETVLPTLVSNHTSPAHYDSLGNQISPEVNYKGVEYEEIIPLLIAGVNSQQEELASKDSIINNLNDRLTQLENCLGALLPILCEINNSMVLENTAEEQKTLRTMLNVELSDKENIVLDQNVPNPFAERTIITYNIPASVQKAQIHFYNTNGQLINTVDVVERGEGQINVFGSDLSTGIYTYTLVADGKIVASKKMMKQ